ncbi:MAG: hypothetical protein M1825_003510, partial [Sarcosagium campestre]
MLPRFRIRNLQPFGGYHDGVRYEFEDSSANHESHGTIVSISAPAYDALVNRHPPAVLTYMDEDDGEIVTVCSSLELSQRLDEPVSCPTSQPRHQRSLPQGAFQVGRTQDSLHDSQLHSFFIQNVDCAYRIWNEYLADNPSTGLLDSQQSHTSGKRKDVGTFDFDRYLLDHTVDQMATFSTPSLVPRKSSLHQINDPGATSTHHSTELDDDLYEDTQLTSTIISPVAVGERKAYLPASNSATCDENIVHQTSDADASPDQVSRPDNPTKPLDSFDSTSQPSLLDAFVDQLSKVSEGGSTSLDNESHRMTTSSIHSTTTEPRPNLKAGQVVNDALRSVFNGLSVFASEIHRGLPEVQDQFRQSPQHVPQAIDRAFQNAFRGFGSHMNNLAQIVQDSSAATKEAAEKIREADARALERALKGFRSVVTGARGISGNLFSPPATIDRAQYAEPSQMSSGSENTTSQVGTEGVARNDAQNPYLTATPPQYHQTNWKAEVFRQLDALDSRSSDIDIDEVFDELKKSFRTRRQMRVDVEPQLPDEGRSTMNGVVLPHITQQRPDDYAATGADVASPLRGQDVRRNSGTNRPQLIDGEPPFRTHLAGIDFSQPIMAPLPSPVYPSRPQPISIDPIRPLTSLNPFASRLPAQSSSADPFPFHASANLE